MKPRFWMNKLEKSRKFGAHKNPKTIAEPRHICSCQSECESHRDEKRISFGTLVGGCSCDGQEEGIAYTGCWFQRPCRCHRDNDCDCYNYTGDFDCPCDYDNDW